MKFKIGDEVIMRTPWSSCMMRVGDCAVITDVNFKYLSYTYPYRALFGREVIYFQGPEIMRAEFFTRVAKIVLGVHEA